MPLPQKTLAHTAKANQIHSPFPKPFEISQLKANWEPHIPNGPLLSEHHNYNGNQNPFLEKLMQQQPTYSCVTTELKWGEASPEFFI